MTGMLRPAPHPGKPKRVQAFPLNIDLSFSVFSFFLPLSLLAVTPSPLRHLRSAGGIAGNMGSLLRPPPFEMSDPRGFVLARDEKVPNAAPNGSG